MKILYKVCILSKYEKWKIKTTLFIFSTHKSIRDGHFPSACLVLPAGRENEVANHFELPLFEYRPETALCTTSSSSCWSVFLEQAPPMMEQMFSSTILYKIAALSHQRSIETLSPVNTYSSILA